MTRDQASVDVLVKIGDPVWTGERMKKSDRLVKDVRRRIGDQSRTAVQLSKPTFLRRPRIGTIASFSPRYAGTK